MKRLLVLLGFLTASTSLFAVGNSNPLVVSSGTFRGIDLYENNSGGFRQAVVIGDATSSTTVTVDALTGLNVHLSTGATQNVVIQQPSVLGATVTYNGTQQVNVGTLYQPSVLGATVTFNGTQNVQLQTGANAIGSITNTSFGLNNLVTTSYIVNPATVTITTLYQPSVIGATVTYNGTQIVIANQGGALWGSTVTYNGQQAVMISTMQVITNSGGQGSVGYHSQASSVPVNVLNTVTIAGSISNTSFGLNNQATTSYVVNPTTTTIVNPNALNVVSTSVVITANIPNVSSTNTYVTNVTTTTDRVLVSSNIAFPSSAADAAQTQLLGDNKGRLITIPLADWGKVKVATVTLAASVIETVFISSGGAGITNHLVGCIGENTSATATDITLRNSGNSVNTNSFKLGMSASNVPVGFFPPMGIPQIPANTMWTVQSGASVSSLNLTCWYFPYAP